MAEDSGDSDYVEAGIRSSLKVIPDHQMESLGRIADDSLRLFRITLVVLSVFATIFGFILRIGPQAVVGVLENRVILISLFLFVIALGGTMTGYRISSQYLNNAMKATEYIKLAKKVPRAGEEEMNENSLTYEYYVRKGANFGKKIRTLQHIVNFSSFFLYSAVIYAPMGFIGLYVEIPDVVFILSIAGPMVLAVSIAKLMEGLFGGYEGPVFIEREDDEEGEDEGATSV